MQSGRTHLLSITLTPTTVEIAETKRSGAVIQTLRQSTLTFSENAGLNDPNALGKLLDEHLRQQGYTTRHAVIGLSARWVLARHKNLPPADSDAMRGIVSLQIEREFASSSAEMCFDYVSSPGGPGGAAMSVLIAGVRRSVLQQAEQFAQAAGLKTVAITPTSLAVAPERDGVYVLVEAGIATVMRARSGAFIGLATCPVVLSELADEASRSRLTSNIARCIMQLPPAEGEDEVTLVLPGDLSESDAKSLLQESSARFGKTHVHRCASALLLAEAASDSGRQEIDFLDSRLKPPPQKSLTPAKQWLLRGAAAVLLLVGLVSFLWFSAVNRRDSLQAEYDGIREQAEELDKVLSDMRRAEAWYDKRPPSLECFLELTRTFPSQGEIRVETLTLRDDMTGQIDCSAANRETMDEYFKQLQLSEVLRDVNPGGVRPTGGKSTWIDFQVSFRYVPKTDGGRS